MNNQTVDCTCPPFMEGDCPGCHRLRALKEHERIAFEVLEDYIEMLKKTGDTLNDSELNYLLDRAGKASENVNAALGIFEPLPKGFYPSMPASPLPEFYEMYDGD